MPEWPNSDMDKLFQEGSEQYDFEYNPEAWQQMDNLLNQQERRRRALWWIWGGVAVAFTIALFSIFFFVENTPNRTTDIEKDIPIETEKNHSATQPAQSETNRPNDTNQQEKVLGETIRQEQMLPTKPDNEVNPNAGFQQSPSFKKAKSNKATSPPETKTATAPPIAENGTSGDPFPPIDLKPSEVAQIPAALDDTDDMKGHSITEKKVVTQLDAPDHLPYLAIPLFTENCSPMLQLPTLFSEGDGDDPNKPKPSFLIGLLGASEFNSVGQGDYTEMNWKFGVQLEYRFAPHFAVKTGANYIHMWYDAGEGEYEPGGNFWVDGIAPVSTRGQCNMVEIPILLSYHFNGHRNNGFFATAGLASYIILEEHYWYDYEYPPTDPIWYWGTYKNEHDWLNIGYLSGGYNMNLFNRWSLQIGPYFQLPLKGVGHGKVEIYSLGLQAVMGFGVK